MVQDLVRPVKEFINNNSYYEHLILIIKRLSLGKRTGDSNMC